MPTMWLVDDTFLDRMLVREVVSRHHPAVTFRGFASAADVAAACATMDEDVVLVVTDINLEAGETAADIVPLVRAARPDVPVVVWSGLITEAIHAEYVRLGADEVLEKPCDLTGLRAILDRLLPASALLTA